MKTGICKVCGSDKTSPTMIGGSKFKWCNACGQMDMMQTNADRIRAMSDEELAELHRWSECEVCIASNYCAWMELSGKQKLACKDIILNWLKQEVE